MMEALLDNLEPVVVVVAVVAAVVALEAGCPGGEVVTAIANPLMERLGPSSRLDGPQIATIERGLLRSLQYSEV